MNAKQVIAILSKVPPEMEVMIQDGESTRGPWEINWIQVHTASKNEFPNDFNMPAGFKFVLIEN